MLHLRADLVRMDKAVEEPDTGASCFYSYTVDKESEHGGVGKPTRPGPRPDAGCSKNARRPWPSS